tara:strand:- start:7381 stop:7803 length:423 start_codon:yes stop_codon:yes gene_type:complete
MSTFVIVNKQNDSLFSEPSRPSWKGTSYKSEGAAKAGITRTIKFYEKAVADVERVVAEGEKEYASRMYNAFRDATDTDLGRTHLADRDNYRVMSAEEYALIEPMITKTGKSPYNGKEITVTQSINTPHYMDPLSESYYTR